MFFINAVTLSQIKKAITDDRAFEHYFYTTLIDKHTSLQLERQRANLGKEIRKIKILSKVSFEGKVQDVRYIYERNQLGIIIDIGISNTLVTFFPHKTREQLQRINKGDVIKVRGRITLFTMQPNRVIDLIVDSDPPKEFREKVNNSSCFIATVAFEHPDAPEVERLRHFRDHTLKKSRVGAWFINLYYIVSPSIASLIGKCEFLKRFTRLLIRNVFLKWIN